MTKTSVWKQAEYYMSFGVDDVVCLDLEVHIHKEGESFHMEIVTSRLAATKMEFAAYLLKLLTVEGLTKFNEDIHTTLVAELTPSLFTLFYAGNLLPDSNGT